MAATGYYDDDNCRGAWLFDDDLTDESACENDLTASGTWAEGYSTTRPSQASSYGTQGKSIHLDNANNDTAYRTEANLCADFPGKAAKEDFSGAVWFKRDDANENYFYLMDKDESWVIGGWWVTNGDNLNMRIEDADTEVTKTLMDINDTDWHHVVFSFDGSAETLTVWVSTSSFGDELDEATYTYTNVGGTRAPEWDKPFRIGSGGSGGAEYLDGYIYQPIVFDRTLDATAAENLYDNGIMGPAAGGSSIVPMVSYYNRRRTFWMNWEKKGNLWLTGM